MVPVEPKLWEYFVYEYLRVPRALMQTARTQATRKMQQLLHVDVRDQRSLKPKFFEC